jgi:lipoate-protein ligase B
MQIYRLGRTDPKAIDLSLQRERERRFLSSERKKSDDLLFIYEPTEAFSVNREKDMESVRKATESEFRHYITEKSIPIIKTKRGGGMIWHGPGQICLAPLIDLEKLEINGPDYTCILERACIEVLRHFNIAAATNRYIVGAQGAWVKGKDQVNRKIAFLGWSCGRGMAIHGCAINVCPDLYPFSLIDPCNLQGVEATSMEREISPYPTIEKVGELASEIFINLLYSRTYAFGQVQGKR